ncbi:hypothetical protein [Massilibacteroides sp.]|uniref:hypothetical protein n=1 Tax=Massilibacteroides sp. TaxID=2034766 RepID=UPI00260C49C5|nr:hypothetical protein [Massilibacteroides sp.]MDD4514686.1 hypothetical protein [Massilibacteroides sp.]
MKTRFVLLFLFIVIALQAQQPVTWQQLAEIKWKTAYDPTNQFYYDIPQHSKTIKKLNKQEITIQGFYVPIDAEGKYFALSATPSSMCFFCSMGGIETVMEIIVKKGHTDLKRIKTDKYIELKGRFVLNMNYNEHLMYMLEDAELVKVLK